MKESKSTSIESARKTEAREWKSMGVPINSSGKTIKVGGKSMARKMRMPKMRSK